MVVEINKDAGHIYGPDTFVSEHTNRPIDENAEEAITPEFWCEICQVKLRTAHTAIQHVGGKPHKKKIVARRNQPVQKSQNEAPKRKLIGEPSNNLLHHGPDPATKKLKPAEPVDQNLTCEDCNLTFNNTLMAIQHFKGKKHATVIAAKLEAKKAQALSKWQAGAGNSQGRKRGGSGRRGGGRNDRGSCNIAGELGRGAVAGQLVKALKNFYDQAPNSSFSDSPYNSFDNIQHNELQNNYSLSSSNHFSAPSSYPTKERFGLTSVHTQVPQRDMYNNNSSGYYSNPSFSTSNPRLNAWGTGNYYTKDYWRK